MNPPAPPNGVDVLPVAQTVQATREPYPVEPREPHPLGATVMNGGVNFSVFSEHATCVELLLFDEHNSVEPFQMITLGWPDNRSFHFWHGFVRGLPAGTYYAYRVDGAWDPSGRGYRF